MSYYDLQNYYQDVWDFNSIANNLTNITKDKLKAQAKVLLEECKELIEGIDTDNQEEILDGAVDVTYVVFGMLQMLSVLGYDTSKAMQKTANNNLTKFPSDIDTVNQSIGYYERQSVTVLFEYNDIYEQFVLKDSHGKIRKPIGYVKNDLKDCLP